jgi:deoxyribodipyrimidine photolyase-related protein
MMNEVAIILPHQLFLKQDAIAEGRKIFLVEHPHFFTRFSFHKQKLIYHRATMLDYLERIKNSGFKAQLIRYDEYAQFSTCLKKSKVHIVDPIEHDLVKEFRALDSIIYPSAQFLTPKTMTDPFVKKGEHVSMQTFYIAQRKRMEIMVEGGKPIGGKWSFDTENRLKMPKGQPIMPVPSAPRSKWVTLAIDSVEKDFPSNPGRSALYLPIDHEGASAWLDDFLVNRLELFGVYEDAIESDESFLFHSVLSPMLNIGLLEPLEIVQKTLEFAKKHHTPLNSLEGFIRQIIGWREYMKMTYDHLGHEMRKSNFFHHLGKLPKSFYTATTGVVPVDQTIKKVWDFAYCHHIERLMVLGNFMLLSRIHPQAVYEWFMELFIDAYDWVMVPNVFAMSQYADGGQITTKPYVSSSNYILKMSNYPKGDWTDVWDALYWTFIDSHAKVFAKNPRMTMMLAVLNKMESSKKKKFLDLANRYFKVIETSR